MQAIVRTLDENVHVTILETPDKEFGHAWLLAVNNISQEEARILADTFNDCLEEYVQKRIQEARLDRISNAMFIMAHEKITRVKGKDYAPDVHELQAKINELINTEKS